MKELDISDNELKKLLQNEGLDEPSMSFNRNILEKLEGPVAKPLAIPKWIWLVFALLFLTPMAVILWKGGFRISLFDFKWSSPQLPFDINLNSTYQYILFLSVGIVWLAFFFNKILADQRTKRG